MTQQSKPRFVHYQQPFGNYSGMTIAYVRDENFVFFAYALCHKHDTYTKSIGRDVTTETLWSIIDDLPEVESFDYVKRGGTLTHSTLVRLLRSQSLDAILADHMLDDMTFMDVKHSYIAKMLLATVAYNLTGTV